jgi:hypothetical protein
MAPKLAQRNNQTNQIGKRSINRNQPTQAYDKPPDIVQPEKCSLLFTGGNIAEVF